jgi:hypothetical protein
VGGGGPAMTFACGLPRTKGVRVKRCCEARTSVPSEVEAPSLPSERNTLVSRTFQLLPYSRCMVAQHEREMAMSDLDVSADRPWTLEAVQELRTLAREGVSVSVISLKLKRTLASVEAKLLELGITPRSHD